MQGSYFLTICTHERRPVLSRIVEGIPPKNDPMDIPYCTELLPWGIIADKYINQLSDFYEDITVEHYVIMPNHIHLLVRISENGASGTPPPTRLNTRLSRFVSTFKRFCNKEYGRDIWQRNYYDHIIRNWEDYWSHKQYIDDNPRRWRKDELYFAE